MNSFLLLFVFGFLVLGTDGCQANGRTYSNGEEWIERNAFVMKCTIEGTGSWRTQVTHCLTTTGLRIPIDSSQTQGNYVFKCQTNDNGNIALIQDLNPDAKCDGHPVGSRWIERSFELECRPGGIKELKSCVTEDGQTIGVNSSRDVGGFTLICQQFPNGTVLFHGAKSLRAPSNFGPQHSYKCIDEQSRERPIGDYWVENHRFNKTCRPNGAVEVVNCITKDGHKIPLNGQLIKDNTKYSCEMTSQGTIRYAAGPVNN